VAKELFRSPIKRTQINLGYALVTNEGKHTVKRQTLKKRGLGEVVDV
jgi:hypothetical protein